MNRKHLSLLMAVVLMATFLVQGALPASAESITGNFEAFTLGSVNGQDGWSMTGPYDVAVVANTFGFPPFGTKSLRISNAVTSGAFGDQTLAKQLANEAGETAAYTAAPSGIRQTSFVAQWDFASTVPGAEQPGLSITASPDRGDGGRMSWVQMADKPAGLEVNFYDYQDVAPYGSLATPADGRSASDDFVLTNLASGLARNVRHTIRMEMDLLDGPHNDVVRVYVDGLLKHTGTSWEDYFRWMQGPGDPEQTAPVHESRTIRTMLFRASGTAVPATLGNGFVIDNLTTTSATPAPMASTNDINRTNGWAHVDQTAVSAVSTTLQFIQPSAFLACFEYRTDGDTSQRIGPTNYNPAVTDGLYPFYCQNNNSSTHTITAQQYVEVRMVFGAEADERFDWTRFDLLPPSLSANTTDPLFCVGETTTVNIDLAGVENLYGYQFEVSYVPATASATGMFSNGFFNTAGAYIVWNADCTTPGTCKFAVTKQASVPPAPPVLPVSGSGTLAQITLTGVAPGAFNMAISNDTLSDIDGIALAHDLGAPLPITVCGNATISGFITMQGRPGNNVSTGTVSMTEQAPTNFSPVAPVAFDVTTGAYSIQVPYMPGGSSYKIVAEHSLYLDNEDTITVAANLAAKNTRLWGGDADNNTEVRITDLSCIGGAFGQSPVTTVCGGPLPAPTGSPDINEDGKVNIQDLSLAGGNFDKCGAQPWAWNATTPNFCP